MNSSSEDLNNSQNDEEYEEDFEKPSIVEPEQNTELKSKADFLSLNSAKQSEDLKYRPNNVFKAEIATQKKSLQALEKENQQLHIELTALSDEINFLIESNASAVKKVPKKEKSSSKYVSSNIQEKKAVNYEIEYNQIKETYDKFNDVNFIMKLKNEVREKQGQIAILEKNAKKIQFTIESKQKELDHYDEKEIPESKTLLKQLINEKIQISDSIQNLELAIEKHYKQHEKTLEKTTELQEKFEKLQFLSKQFPLNSEILENPHKPSTKFLKKLQSAGSARLAHLKIQEHDAKAQKDLIEKDLKHYQQSIKSKADVLSKVRNELEEALQMASSTNLNSLAILIRSTQRSGSVKHSLSPRCDTERNREIKKEESTEELKRPGRNLSTKALMEKKEVEKIRENDKEVKEIAIDVKEEKEKNADLEEIRGGVMENKEDAKKVYVRPSIFEELDAGSAPVLKETLFISNLQEKKIEVENFEGKRFERKELEGKEHGVVKGEMIPLQGSEKNSGNDVFKNIDLPDPTKKRNRAHLSKAQEETPIKTSEFPIKKHDFIKEIVDFPNNSPKYQGKNYINLIEEDLIL